MFNMSVGGGDTLIAITSICAVIVSIMSMISTIAFSMLQVRHNKKSVRPISLLYTKDYENLLAVEVKNVGTGPLLITKLIAKNNSLQSSALIDLLPNVDQYWSTYTGAVDGWAIPVGGKISLIEIEPQSEAIRTKVRHALAKTTILLEYTDIYQTKFRDEKKLSFFERHETY